MKMAKVWCAHRTSCVIQRIDLHLWNLPMRIKVGRVLFVSKAFLKFVSYSVSAFQYLHHSRSPYAYSWIDRAQSIPGIRTDGFKRTFRADRVDLKEPRCEGLVVINHLAGR